MECPLLIVATKGSQYEKVIGNMEEVRSRVVGMSLLIATEGDENIQIRSHCDDVILRA